MTATANAVPAEDVPFDLDPGTPVKLNETTWVHEDGTRDMHNGFAPVCIPPPANYAECALLRRRYHEIKLLAAEGVLKCIQSTKYRGNACLGFEWDVKLWGKLPTKPGRFGPEVDIDKAQARMTKIVNWHRANFSLISTRLKKHGVDPSRVQVH